MVEREKALRFRGFKVAVVTAALALSSALSLHAAGDAALFLKLVSRFESPAVRLLLEESGLPKSVLGRVAKSTEDYNELARVLTLDETANAGRALEGRLKSQSAILEQLDDLERLGGRFSTNALVRARFEVARLAESPAFKFLPEEFGVTQARVYARNREAFLNGSDSPIAVPLTELSAANALSMTQAQAVAAHITRPLAQAEFAEQVAFLAKQFKTTDAEILARLDRNRVTMRELIDRSKGIRPQKGMTSIRAAVMDKIREGLVDRRMANPAFERYVATLVATEIMVTLVSESTARGEDFWNELDYFTADLITFTLAEIVLTWVTHAKATSALSLRGAKPQAATVFDPGFGAQERGAALVRSGVMLSSAGFGLGLIGNGTVELSKAIRDRHEQDAPGALERLERVVWNAFLCGAFMGVSSNLRYQAVSKIAMILQQRLATNTAVQSALLMGLSYGNSFIGGTTYVFFEDWATPGMQESLKRMGFDVKLKE